jgi:hypothetical protein
MTKDESVELLARALLRAHDASAVNPDDGNLEAAELLAFSDLREALSRPSPTPSEDVVELLARIHEIGGNKAAAFSLRSVGLIGTVFAQQAEAIHETLARLSPSTLMGGGSG